MNIAEFLLARIAEDEVVARAAGGPWQYQDVASVGGGRICDPTVAIADLHYDQPGEVDPRIRRAVLSEEADRNGTHIARHDPTRVLAECEAKRRIVAICNVPDPHTAEEAGGGCTECAVLYTLALPYADHPDYREEWRP